MPAQGAEGPPSGFTDTAITGGLGKPMALAVLPDGRTLVAVKGGMLRVIDKGRLLAAPALDLSNRICTNHDRGLIGLAADPQFTSNHFIYLFWTRKIDPQCSLTTLGAAENRIIRYILRSDSTIDPDSAKVLADHIPSLRYHNAGDLLFGRDGFLYATVGDGHCDTGCGIKPAAAQRLNTTLGKVLRITRDGRVPASNPYVGAAGSRRCAGSTTPVLGSGPCIEIYASGFRNPFRISKSTTGAMNVNDVGESSWEEVDRLAMGRNYGWPMCEGSHLIGSSEPCARAGLTGPVAEYNHSTGCTVITAGAFVPGRAWGTRYEGSYLFADYACGTIFELRGDRSVATFATGLGQIVSMKFRPATASGALLYLTHANGGELRVIRKTA